MKATYLLPLVSLASLIALPAAALADGDLAVTVTSAASTSAATSSDSDSNTSSTSSTSTTPVAAPTITTQPASAVANAGGNVTFSVVAAGSGTLQYHWLKNERWIDGATSAALTLNNIAVSDAGTYSVIVSNDGGRVVSKGAELDVNAVAGTITTAPQDQTVNAGGNVTFSVTTAGTGLTYQWRRDGHMLSGDTSATLALNDVGVLDAGTYSVVISNSTGVAAVASAMLTVNTDARLTNISTRGEVGLNDEQLIVGFVIHGQGSKNILVRAVGPTLQTEFGISNALTTPKLTLQGFSKGKFVTDTNTAWGGGATLAQTFTQVGAFPLPPNSADAALLETLDSGVFTANVTGLNGTTGIALAEMYDADTGTPAARLVNISARAKVGAEAANTLIAGFSITGTTSDTVLIRGVGPTLGTQFGMREALGASQVTLYDSKGNQIAVNSGWGLRADGEEDTEKETDMDAAGDRVGAFHLDHGSHDSAMLVTLAPGVYTAHVTGVNNQTGIALVEVYEVR